jgi:hypothetical protein
MGLLDEAIREHLELKLRNGADPAQIAAEEREALEPALVDPDAEAQPATAPESGSGSEQDAEEYEQLPAAPVPADPAHELPQETVEFDMRTVIDPAPQERPLPQHPEQEHADHEQLGFE